MKYSLCKRGANAVIAETQQILKYNACIQFLLSKAGFIDHLIDTWTKVESNCLCDDHADERISEHSCQKKMSLL